MERVRAVDADQSPHLRSKRGARRLDERAARRPGSLTAPLAGDRATATSPQPPPMSFRCGRRSTHQAHANRRPRPDESSHIPSPANARSHTMTLVQESPPVVAQGGLERPRAASLGADRLLLPDARLAVRGRGRRAGDAHPRLARLSTASRAARRCARGSTGSPRTSASTCSTAASAARGRWTSARRRRPWSRQPEHRCPRSTWIEPIPDEPGQRRERPRRGRGRARDDPPGVRRRAAAPAAAPARRADPVRGAALEGHRGRGAARHERRLGQQRAAAGPRDARGTRHQQDTDAAAPTGRGRAASCWPATSRRSSATTWTR